MAKKFLVKEEDGINYIFLTNEDETLIYADTELLDISEGDMDNLKFLLEDIEYILNKV